MIRSLAALVLNYNEAEMLRITLPPLKACVDEVIIVDMGSTDDSHSIFSELLDGRDKIIAYPRENLFAYGFAHARNFGASFCQSEWQIAVDADELVDPNEVEHWRASYNGNEPALHLPRKNYSNDGSHNLQAIELLIAEGPHTIEHPCRIYRNYAASRWEGVIHEEVWHADRVGWKEGAFAQVTLHHLNAFKPAEETIQKHKLYFYLTLKAVAFPRLRFGTNAYWFDVYAPHHLERMLNYANAFCLEQGLPELPEEMVRSALVKQQSEGAQ